MDNVIQGHVVEPIRYTSLLCMADSCLCFIIFVLGAILGILFTVYISPFC